MTVQSLPVYKMPRYIYFYYGLYMHHRIKSHSLNDDIEIIIPSVVKVAKEIEKYGNNRYYPSKVPLIISPIFVQQGG